MPQAPAITVCAPRFCYRHSLRQVLLVPRAARAYAARMILRLKDKDFLRLRGARGIAIEVVGGRVWITEDGRTSDSFLGAGGRYHVGGDGLVLIGAENDETALRLVA